MGANGEAKRLEYNYLIFNNNNMVQSEYIKFPISILSDVVDGLAWCLDHGYAAITTRTLCTRVMTVGYFLVHRTDWF